MFAGPPLGSGKARSPIGPFSFDAAFEPKANRARGLRPHHRLPETAFLVNCLYSKKDAGGRHARFSAEKGDVITPESQEPLQARVIEERSWPIERQSVRMITSLSRGQPTSMQTSFSTAL
jgi:hypothetical protein